jgi:hypothetical protein
MKAMNGENQITANTKALTPRKDLKGKLSLFNWRRSKGFIIVTQANTSAMKHDDTRLPLAERAASEPLLEPQKNHVTLLGAAGIDCVCLCCQHSPMDAQGRSACPACSDFARANDAGGKNCNAARA